MARNPHLPPSHYSNPRFPIVVQLERQTCSIRTMPSPSPHADRADKWILCDFSPLVPPIRYSITRKVSYFSTLYLCTSRRSSVSRAKKRLNYALSLSCQNASLRPPKRHAHASLYRSRCDHSTRPNYVSHFPQNGQTPFDREKGDISSPMPVPSFSFGNMYKSSNALSCMLHAPHSVSMGGRDSAFAEGTASTAAPR
jgi:hypothetical protein